MNSVIEKEKKLNLALTKLKNINLQNPDIKKNIENLSNQKNQLEIEKQELEEKYKSLINDYNDLTKKLDKFQNQERIDQKKQIEFSEKIDEFIPINLPLASINAPPEFPGLIAASV